MTDLEIAFGVLGTASTLNGYTIANNVFARSLEREEETGLYPALTAKKVTEEQANAVLRGIGHRREGLNLVLIATTMLFSASVYGSLTAVTQAGVDGIHISESGFISLLMVLVVWLLYVGVRNLYDSLVAVSRLSRSPQ